MLSPDLEYGHVLVFPPLDSPYTRHLGVKQACLKVQSVRGGLHCSGPSSLC